MVCAMNGACFEVVNFGTYRVINPRWASAYMGFFSFMDRIDIDDCVGGEAVEGSERSTCKFLSPIVTLESG